MKSLSCTWKGTTPLLMHSCKCVNPLHPISVELSKYTSKKNKTLEDLEKISDLQWEAGAYWDDTIGLYIPSECVEATLKNGGVSKKKGKDIQKYVTVADLMIPFNYYADLTKEELIADYKYRDTRPVNIMRSKVMQTRPRFDRWEITFTLMYDESKIDLDVIVDAMEYAGVYVGLCDYRPKYGKFVATIKEID